MRFGPIRDLIAHAGREGECPAIFKLGPERAIQAEKDVAFGTPMVGKIPARIFDHTNPYRPEVLRPPISHTRFAFVLCLFNTGPICSAEWNI